MSASPPTQPGGLTPMQIGLGLFALFIVMVLAGLTIFRTKQHQPLIGSSEPSALERLRKAHPEVEVTEAGATSAPAAQEPEGERWTDLGGRCSIVVPEGWTVTPGDGTMLLMSASPAINPTSDPIGPTLIVATMALEAGETPPELIDKETQRLNSRANRKVIASSPWPAGGSEGVLLEVTLKSTAMSTHTYSALAFGAAGGISITATTGESGWATLGPVFRQSLDSFRFE